MNKELEQYILNHTQNESPVLAELNRDTHLKVLFPNMLSGQLQGQFIKMLIRMSNATLILEIGTYTGYSAICMAEALPEKGKIITIDRNDELVPFTKKYIKKAGLEKKIEMEVGDAMKIIPEINSKFDFVFIDADKSQYLDYYKLIFDKVKTGGYMLADNVLWYNKVITPIKEQDKDTQSICKFNDYVQQDKRVENVLIPIRDGLMLIYKKSPGQ